MNWILIAMIFALLIPIYEACQDEDIWQKCWRLPASPAKPQS